MRNILSCFLPFIAIFAMGQGDQYILFSKTGDTLITRTSCYCKSKDTLTTYFNVLGNCSGNLRIISVFQIREPNKNSIPCADFGLVPKDTLAKYGLVSPGKLGIMPKRYKVKSRVWQMDTATTDKGEFIYIRQIRHTFHIGGKMFYSATVWNTSKNKKDKIDIPKIHKVFGSKTLHKYHFVVIIVNASIDKQTGKMTTSYTHTRIIN